MRELYIFVEGDTDKDFFISFLKHEIRNHFGFEMICIDFIQKKQEEMIKNVIAAKELFMVCPDLDVSFSDEVMKEKREKVKKRYLENMEVEDKHFAIIIKEIESWCLAGFNKNFYEREKITDYYYKNTEETTKGTFKTIAKNKRKSYEQFKSFLENKKSEYVISEARERNSSFDQFWKKLETLFVQR